MAGDADLAGRYHQELAGSKLVRVIREDGVEALDLGLKLCAGKPEEEDAFVLEPLVEDQLAKVAVSNHEDPLLLSRYCEYVLIGKAMRVVAGDSRYVVAQPAKTGDQAKISALVEEKFHTGVALDRSGLGALGNHPRPRPSPWQKQDRPAHRLGLNQDGRREAR